MRYEQGFIAVTSDKWFDFIFSHDVRRVNFWCKKKAFKAILPGQPLFFLRKNSKGENGERKVVGFGILENFELNSCQKAWNLYEVGNGFSSYDEFNEGVKEILDKTTDDNLGCIVLNNVMFFSKPVLLSELGIGFAPAIVSGKTINSDEVAAIIEAGGDSQLLNHQLDEERDKGFVELNIKDKKLAISQFTKDLLRKKEFLLDHSDNTRIRFSTDHLDSIVGFIGEGWSKQIKRLLLFEIEIENNMSSYILNLIIGPGPQEIRNQLYTKARENSSLYKFSRGSLSKQYTSIYNEKILNKEQLTNYSVEELKQYISQWLDGFIKYNLNPLCEGLKSTQRVELEKELSDIMSNNVFKNIEETEQLIYTKARIGHSKLKKMLVEKYGCCKICGLSDARFLIASHIKPWSQSTNYERLDFNNILLLCPHHDAVFDKGYITFDRDGVIMISSELTTETRALLNLNTNQKIGFTHIQRKYLSWHRENVFRP